MTFLLLFLIPLIVAVVVFLLFKEVTWPEFLLQVGAQAVIAVTSVAIIHQINVSDTAVVSGTVVSKARERVSCEHSYPCHCVSHESCSGKPRTCTTYTTCSTCYWHSYDYDWAVYDSRSLRFEVDRVDPQGTQEPRAFTATKNGDPTATTESYENPLKGARGSLFKRDTTREDLPEYPSHVEGLYTINRVVLWGANVQPKKWNDALARLNGRLQGANVVLVLMDQSKTEEDFQDLEAYWVGGKHNDVIIAVNLEGSNIRWVRVMAWSLTKDVHVHLRDDVQGLKRLEVAPFISVVERNVRTYYREKPLADFEHLKYSITPTTTELIIALVVGLLVALGFFHQTEVF